MRTWEGAALCLVVGAGMVGCLRDGGPAGSAGPALSTVGAAGEPALRLEDYRGKVVLLHFWHAS